MIEKVAIPPTKNAIQNIARLVHNASENKKKMEEEEKKKQQELLEKSKPISFLGRSLYSRAFELEPIRKSEPVSVPGVGTVDKIAIAQQIAAALTAQGKSNISNEELESLTNAVVGMAEASRNSDKPVTAADFVKGLTGSTGYSANNTVISSTNNNSVSTSNTVTNTNSINTTSSNSNDSKNDSASISIEKLKAKSPEKDKPIDHAAKMESLSDSDLKALLQNFKDLSSDEQHGLINFLKKLEATDSVRVERLRAYVNLGPSSSPRLKAISPIDSRDDLVHRTDKRRSASPFSSRQGTHNPCDDEENWKPKLDIFADEEAEAKKKKLEDKPKAKLDFSDDDDDDYTFEDIYKAADKNVIENEKAKKRTFSSRSKSKSPRSWTRSRSRSRSPVYKKPEYSKPNDPNAILNETKRLIANIMGDLPTKNVYKSHVSPLSEASNLSNPPPPTSLLPSVSTSTNIPSNFGQNYGINPPPSNTQLPYSSSQFQTYPPHQPSQAFNNNSNFNGYSNFNQGYNNMSNQTQYSGDQYSSNTSYPPSQSNYGGSSYGNGPPSVRPPQSSYSQQSYGNYSQQGRFY